MNIKDTIVHPNYIASQKYHDIAILELENPVEFNEKIWPACLHSEVEYHCEKNLTIAGFGRNDLKDRKLTVHCHVCIYLNLVIMFVSKIRNVLIGY